jgi:hypothetical protein
VTGVPICCGFAQEPDTSDEEPDHVPDDRPLSLAELQVCGLHRIDTLTIT